MENSRLKFRVWNKHINEYCNIQNLFILPTGETGYFITDGSYSHQRKFMHQEDMIIEMSTGLKDKNGNLIYEGDIIKDEFCRKFKVIWSEEDCMFEGRVIYCDLEYSDRFDFYKGATDNCEIIGNIHEQPEQKDVK